MVSAFERAARVSIGEAREQFVASLAGRSERTRRTYATALDRLSEHLAEAGLGPDEPTSALPRDLLEGFYLWCVRRYGAASRTVPTYLAGVRALCRFLDRHGLSAVGYEQLKA